MVNKLLLPFIAAATGVAAQSTGVTTRYWDCCKPSCGWTGKASVSKPVLTCDKGGNTLTNPDTRSGCDSGGTAFTCTNYSPWAVNDTTAYGFAAVKLQGGTEASWCCACYALTFTSGPIAGKQMIVQATNTGGDLGNNHFDILIPGGGELSRKDAPLSSVVGTGVLNTEAFLAATSALSFRLLSNKVANSASIGSKERTTPMLASSRLHALLSLPPSLGARVSKK
ncbi:hypothetical protein V5O48_018398 [Marasmius crinis-equi]|uniref:Cellulase n=1 Tax=Marasmius crinis-equi TaxID=585013 RepID=A0ABR3ELA3_9AGAR